MSRRRPPGDENENATQAGGSHMPILTPPSLGDRWYRIASDISHMPGRYEEEILDIIEPLPRKDKDEKDKDEIPPGTTPRRRQRPQWGNQLEFLMSCVATSVGLGNVWRFAFVCYENGGGAFLVPYVVVLVFVGKPMYFLECIIGQFSSRNNVRIWSLSPAMRGTGYAQCICIFYMISYYVAIIAMCLYYLILSFQPTLPWSKCNPEWDKCLASNPALQTGAVDPNASSSAELYFINTVLQQPDGIEDGIGTPLWNLALCLFLCWVVIFCIIVQGVKSSGKAAYFLAIFPYVIMFILLITTCTLPGAGKGIMFFITPQWDRIADLNVWYAATTQVFFSLSVGIGPIVMFSSYNNFDAKIYRDSLIVTTLDSLTSLLSGFTIFGILGNLAHNLKTEVTDVIGSGGNGLAFMSYPDAISKTYVPHAFAILFFLMMTVLGLGSAVAFHSVINTVMLDSFPHVKTGYISAISCVFGFLSGIVYVTPGGQYILGLVDYYGGTFLALFGCIAEVIGIAWIYGLENFCLDMEFMLERKPSIYWRFCWGLITPVMMIVVFFHALLRFDSYIYGGYYRLPDLAYVCGYLILLSGMIFVPIYIIKALYANRTGVFRKTCKASFKPKPTWGPRSPSERKRWMIFKSRAMEHQEKFQASKLKHWWLSLTGGYRYNVQDTPKQTDQATTSEPILQRIVTKTDLIGQPDQR